MSISDLVVSLKNTESDWTAREIAELVWLWVQTVISQESERPPQNQETKPLSDTSQIKTKTSSTLQKTNSSSSNVSASSTSAKVDLYPKIVEQYIPPERTKQNQPYPLQVPDAPAIPNKLQIERSLKSLLRKFKSATEKELDEDKTVDLIVQNQIVKQDIWTPVFKPVLTRRWLDLVLVVEVNNSLVIWQQTITELRQLLKRLGIFRQFDTWGLQINLPKTQFSLEWLFFKFIPNRSPEFLVFLAFLIDSHELGSLIRFYQKEGIQLFRYDDYQMRPYPPEAISSQPGRETLILLASDLVSPAWYRPEIYTLLQQWSCRGMVNVLQLLPERLWLRTVLGQQHRLTLNSLVRVSKNQKLITLLSPKDRIISQYERKFLTQEIDNKLSITQTEKNHTSKSPEFKLPVTSLEPYILESWSTFLMGIGNNQSIGYGIKPPQKSAINIFPLSVTSQERIRRFQTIASPTALRLAELLSAVLVTLPVIRVIQYTMLPKSNQSHVAEVLMGGLFQPLTETVTPHNDPDEIEFHFFPGVREELLSWLTVDEITFAIEQVSAYIADKMGKSLREFEALLMSSQYLKSDFAQQIYPFAQVQSQVLMQLGGEYSQLATQITWGGLKPKILTFEVATIEIKETDTFEFDIVTLVPKEQINNRPRPEDIYFREERFSDASSTEGRYQSYQELSNNEQEGIDYRILSRQGNSDVAIVAHHGGKIQLGTTEIADAVAGEDYSFYTFEGLKEGAKNAPLHIPSHKFDEPRALDLVSKANRVIAIHGIADEDEAVYLGGLDDDFQEQIKQSLIKEDFIKIGDLGQYFRGISPQNICNRGQTGKGVQIGISWGLRKQLFDSLKSEDTNEPTLFDRFIQAIRDALSPLEAAGLRSQITQGEADYYTEELGDGVELEMISIPGGSFMMGSPEEELESRDRERPQHQVTVPSFYMGRYPITQRQWLKVDRWEQVERKLNNDPSYFTETFQEKSETEVRWERPVERVSWEDAKEFCARLSRKTGKEYRLPTEAEWEYACRAGTTTPFHFGETISTDLANYRGTDDESMGWKGSYGRGVKGEYREQTTPVGYFKVANNFGLSDMHGNVWEWCEDDWHEDYENAPTDGIAWFSGTSSNRVVRGGSWDGNPTYSRSAYRFGSTRVDRFSGFGFRVVCVAPRSAT